MFEKLLKIFKVHFIQELTLEDGTPIRIDGNLDLGVAVYVLTTDGEISMPDGDYKLSTGEIITVKGGLINDVIEVPAEPTDEPMSVDAMEVEAHAETPVETPVETELAIDPTAIEPMPSNSGDTMETPEVEVEEPEVELIDPMVRMDELETKVSDLTTKMDEILSKMNMITEKFSAAKPVNTKKVETEIARPVPQSVSSRMDILNQLRKEL